MVEEVPEPSLVGNGHMRKHGSRSRGSDVLQHAVQEDVATLTVPGNGMLLLQPGFSTIALLTRRYFRRELGMWHLDL